MSRITNYFLLFILLLTFAGCSSSGSPAPWTTTSNNTVLFDPSASVVPLPNILATATAKDPMMNYSGNYIPRPANKPMNPAEALAYVNTYEMGSTNAVAGLNAPIYIRTASPVNPATVSAATIKIFQLGIDSNGLTENSVLGFTDISSMFTYQYKAGSTDIFAFPNFPLMPGTRYVYVVTNRVLDAATGGAIAGSFFFEALKSTTPLLSSFAALEPIRANTYADPPTNTIIKLSGYAKVMDDLIAKSATTTITSRNQIALLGRFITTGAGFIPTDATNSTTQTASRIPMESALRAFAAGGLPIPTAFTGKAWSNTISGTTTMPAATYWGLVPGAGSAPATANTVTIGAINSGDLSLDPVVVKANIATGIDQSVNNPGAYNPGAGVVQPHRNGYALDGFYFTNRSVPFVYITPTGSAPGTGWPLVIFQHGITGQKEQVVAVAGSLTAAGYAVIAIDLPLHGALAISGHTASAQWGQDFMAVGAPLATRSNIQQAAFNLNRLEFTLLGGGFAGLGADAPDRTTVKPRYVGLSLGSIVGAYYLAGNTSLTPASIPPAAPVPPYTQTSLDADMKGFLSVPGGKTAYLIQNSPAFGPSIDAGLAAKFITKNSPTYHQFFLVTQSIVDPVDPATMTSPLAPGLPSRLSGRIGIQEAVGDQVITNEYNRYFGNALGGREVLGGTGATVAPGFKQLGYGGTLAALRVPATFMYTLTGGLPAPKIAVAAPAVANNGGYFQFDQLNLSTATPTQLGRWHGFLLDPTSSATATGMGQAQMVYFMQTGQVMDPTQTPPPPAKALPLAIPAGLMREILLPSKIEILGNY